MICTYMLQLMLGQYTISCFVSLMQLCHMHGDDPRAHRLHMHDIVHRANCMYLANILFPVEHDATHARAGPSVPV